MVAVFVALGLVLASHEFAMGRQHPWLDVHQTRWMVSLQVALLALAVAAPDPWIAFAIAWIAVHPWVTLVAHKHGWIPFLVVGTDVYRYLWPVLWWFGVYVIVAHLWRPGDWRVVAGTMAAWSAANAAMFAWRRMGGGLPASWVIVREHCMPAGFAGASYRLAWLTATGALSAAALGMVSPWFLVLVPLLALASWETKTRSPILCAGAALGLWGLFVMPVLSAALSPALLLGAIIIRRNKGTVAARKQVWSFAVQLIRECRGWGCGLGSWARLGVQRHEEQGTGIVWANMHNDWLQSLFELGPVPAVCAVAVVVSRWWAFPATPDALYGALVATATAVYAVGYFPLHDHAPALLLAVALAMR